MSTTTRHPQQRDGRTFFGQPLEPSAALARFARPVLRLMRGVR